VTIPNFDEHGNLPPGIHRAYLYEIVERFIQPRSLAREERTKHLKQFLQFVQPFAYDIYINGSYTTSKLSPSDVDIIMILPISIPYQTQKYIVEVIRNSIKNLHIFAYTEDQKDKILLTIVMKIQKVL
jgi:hypothetical protein